MYQCKHNNVYYGEETVYNKRGEGRGKNAPKLSNGYIHSRMCNQTAAKSLTPSPIFLTSWKRSRCMEMTLGGKVEGWLTERCRMNGDTCRAKRLEDIKHSSDWIQRDWIPGKRA